MGTRIFLLFKNHFDLVNHKGFLYESLCRTMVWFVGSFWAMLCKYLFYIFGLITRHTFRYHGGENSTKIDSDCGAVHRRQDEQLCPNISKESEFFGFREKEKSDNGLGCESSAMKDCDNSHGETESPVFMKTVSAINTSKYRFKSGNDICGFMEEPKVVSFTIHEVGLDSNDDSYSKSSLLDSTDKGFPELNMETGEDVNEEKTDDSAETIHSEQEVLETEEHEVFEQGIIAGLKNDCLNKNDVSEEIDSDDNLFSLNLDTPLNSSGDENLIVNDQIDATDDKILSDKSTGNEGMEHDTLMDTDQKKVQSTHKTSYLEDIDTRIADQEVVPEDEFIELEPHLSFFHEGFLSGQDFGESEDEDESEESVHEERQPMDSPEKSEVPSLHKESSSASNSDDDMGCEFLQEHQDYINQLKQELKHVKNGGLPTILEESESLKIVEDLKPLKIDIKMEHKDKIEEIQKFYKSYAEKMRKLDILNNQTMHAIGLLKLKDPAQLNSSKKTSVPVLKSLLSQKFRYSKVGNHNDNSTQKFVRELQRDLELVYIGQVCLSWEILYWQHKKAQELQDYEPHAFRQYNHVAGEYQQFQVLLQRFIENEPFQERPRIQNYVENRCVFRSFLQVPAIKDDCMKDKKPTQEGEYVISIAMLKEIIGESMRLFWEFIHADKDDGNVTSRGLQGAHVNLEVPADLELLMDIQTNFQKKEKKLKELLRVRTCMVKRFQRNHQEDCLNRALFYVQVELKLVAKVLNMSRLTRDQLVWCQRKLEEINFVSRNICIEPSFLLFPW